MSYTCSLIEATNRGPKTYTDMSIDILNYLNTHGYFNSERIDNYITFNLIIKFHELKCPGTEIIKVCQSQKFS